MLTRCPSCGTTFRLRAAQLGQADGRVRCGKCKFAFSALENRIDVDSPDEPSIAAVPDETFPALPAAAAHFSALGHRKRFVAQAEAAFAEAEPASEAEASSPGGEQTSVVPQTPAVPTDTPQAAPAETVELPDEHPATGALAEPSTAPTTELPAEPVVATPADEHAQALAPRDGGESAHANDVERSAATYLIAAEARSDQAPEQQPFEAVATDTAELGERDAVATTSDYLASPAPARRWPLGVIAGLLGVVFLVQIGYAYRTELAKSHPGWRPALEAACKLFGCKVELPRDADRVSIESSDLNPESDKKRLQLAATLKNRADYPQSYPHLELTLTDVRDQPLVRRIFAPGEYLAKGAPPSFGPNAEIAVKLMLEIDEVSASGYRVYLFYP